MSAQLILAGVRGSILPVDDVKGQKVPCGGSGDREAVAQKTLGTFDKKVPPPGVKVNDACWGSHFPAHAAPTTALIAATLTMSLTLQPRDRSNAGFFSPCTTGPIASAPPRRCASL